MSNCTAAEASRRRLEDDKKRLALPGDVRRKVEDMGKGKGKGKGKSRGQGPR